MTSIRTPGSIWAKLIEQNNEKAKKPDGRGDAFVFFVGGRGSGKSTLLNRFLYPTRAEVPKPAEGLEYTYARKPSQYDHERKDLAHIWEVGGSQEFAEAISQGDQLFLTAKQITTAVVVVVVDLSEPGAVLGGVTYWLDQVKKKLASTYEKFEKKGLALPEQLRQRAKTKLYSGNDDKARFAADRGQMITIVSAYSPTEAASDEEAGDFYLRVAALADKANDKRDLLIVAGGSQRRAWDSSQLRRPAVRREFNLQLSDRFGLLEAVPPEGADAQAAYDAMAAAIREVATNHLAPRGSRRRRGWQYTLSQRTLRLMDARQREHSAWLRSKSAAAKRERNRANRAADAAVQRDRERWIGQQVAEAQDMLRKSNLRQFARACDRLAGRSRSHQIPPAMRDASGALHSGPDGVLKAMKESFDKLYGGETKLSDETLNQLENDVAAFELTRATEVDEAHGRPPDLAETEACDVVYHSGIALVIAATKYDKIRDMDPEMLKVLGRTLRFVAHTHGATLVYLSNLQPGVPAADAAVSAPLLDNFSKLMNHLIFTGLEKKPALKMAPQTDHSSALMVPAGTDKLRDIGRPRGQVDDNISQGMVEWKELCDKMFPPVDPEGASKRRAKFVIAEQYADEEVRPWPLGVAPSTP
ncbi:hypothetical protein FOA52_007794 [Chlamydomonas sp. UWO 241]|nr:hypothetical protein FOA52_007794 [Chlamydomonas sp. UWO 241]